jgi:hypothetical protein
MGEAAHTESAIERARAQMLRDGTIKNYRVEDFCAAFGVSERTAWRLIGQGDVEALKAGTRTLITAESADAWRERCPRVKAKVEAS